MLDFQQKRKIRSVAYNKVTLAILFVLVLVMARSTWVVYQKERSSQNMKDISSRSVEELRLREGELDSRIKRLETPVGVEEEIRLKFDVVKGNEDMVVVVEEPENDVSTTTSEVGFWGRVLGLFKD